jgi:hypothetical protein
MQVALEDLKLKHLFVIYPGDIDYPLSKQISVIGFKNYLKKASE